ncbi:MAG: hypothetical protein GX615_14390, partial [Lentisphaerae bacterium]|nr:hypothetical protein [Lentisphaerota bacterium]
MNNQDNRKPAWGGAPQQPPRNDETPSQGEAFPPLPPETLDEQSTAGEPVPLDALVHGVDRAREEPLEHGEDWERPAPVERERHFKAWMLFLGFALLLVAFFQPIKIWIRK